MKFVTAMVVQILLGLFLMAGILKAVGGNYWLLIFATLTYLVIFARAGCTSH